MDWQNIIFINSIHGIFELEIGIRNIFDGPSVFIYKWCNIVYISYFAFDSRRGGSFEIVYWDEDKVFYWYEYMSDSEECEFEVRECDCHDWVKGADQEERRRNNYYVHNHCYSERQAISENKVGRHRRYRRFRPL